MYQSKLILAQALALIGSASVLPRDTPLNSWDQYCKQLQANEPKFPVYSSAAAAFCTSAMNLAPAGTSVIKTSIATVTSTVGGSVATSSATITGAPQTIYVSTQTCYTAPSTSGLVSKRDVNVHEDCHQGTSTTSTAKSSSSSSSLKSSSSSSSMKPASTSSSSSMKIASTSSSSSMKITSAMPTTSSAAASASCTPGVPNPTNSLGIGPARVSSACSCWGFTSVKTAGTATSVVTSTSVATVTGGASTTTVTTTVPGSTLSSGTMTASIAPAATYNAIEGSTYKEWKGYDFYGNDLSLSPCAGGNFTTPAGSFACNGFESCEDVCSQYNQANKAQGSPNPVCVGISYTLDGRFCYLKSSINNCAPIVNANVNSGMVITQK